jgi:hypothetical protein
LSKININIAAMNITQEQMDLEDQIKAEETKLQEEVEFETMDWANEMTTDVKACSIEDDDCEACGA